MTFQLVIKEQLCIFINSLKTQIENKHVVVTESLPDYVNFEIGENMKTEAVKMKLDMAPNFRPNEIGLQCKFIQSEKVISLWAFCLKDFKRLDVADSDTAVWGRAVIRLASLTKASEKLSRGLESRSIRIGLAREYIRMVGESKKLMVFVSAGNGFKSSHWHEEEDVLDIVQYRLKAQKLIKLASEQRSEEKIYCGNPNAQVEYLDDNGAWVDTKNSLVLNKSVGTNTKDGVDKSKDKGPNNNGMVRQDESSEENRFGGNGGADALATSGETDGAVGLDPSQDVRYTSRPRVNQPGRPLPMPPTPRYDDVDQGPGYLGDRWPNDMWYEKMDEQGYHYANYNRGGARRKQLFGSRSTVRLEEKLADKMQLLNDIRDQSLNVGGGNDAGSVRSQGRNGSGFFWFSGSCNK